MRDELVQKYGNPYPVETAVFQLEDGKTSADVTRSLFETAHEYVEGFSVFGDKMSFCLLYKSIGGAVVEADSLAAVLEAVARGGDQGLGCL